MAPKFYKHKLLLDEGIYPRKSFRRLNNRYSIKHIKHDLHKEGSTDKDVYEIACKQKRIIITYNIGDFRKLVTKSNRTGIIGITQAFTPEQLDTRLNSLLSESSEKSFYGKYTSLSGRENLKK